MSAFRVSRRCGLLIRYLGFYCMPEEGVELSPNGKILTDDEVVRLATLFVKNGVTKIRLTGGEPTVRKGLVELVGESEIRGCIRFKDLFLAVKVD